MAISRVTLFMIVLGLVLGLLQYQLWFKPGGMRDMMKMKVLLAQQLQTNEQLKKQNDDLLTQVQHLQNSQDAVETRARNELGMVKKGETFYQVVK